MAKYELAGLVSLSEVTRKERTLLLLVTVVLVAVVFGGFRPTKIEQLGIDFTATQVTALIQLLLLIAGYLLIAFYFYARDDRVAVLAKLAVARDTMIPNSYRTRMEELARVIVRGSSDQLLNVVTELTDVLNNVQELIETEVHVEARMALYSLADYAKAISDGALDAESVRDIGRFVAAVDQRKWPEFTPLTTPRDVVRMAALANARVIAEINTIEKAIESQFHSRVRYRFTPNIVILLERPFDALRRLRLRLLNRHVKRWRRQVDSARLSPYMLRDTVRGMQRTWDDVVSRTAGKRGPLFWYKVKRDPIASALHSLTQYMPRLQFSDMQELHDAVSHEPYVTALRVAFAPHALAAITRSFAKTLRRFRTRLWFDVTLPATYASIIIIIVSVSLVASAA